MPASLLLLEWPSLVDYKRNFIFLPSLFLCQFLNKPFSHPSAALLPLIEPTSAVEIGRAGVELAIIHSSLLALATEPCTAQPLATTNTILLLCTDP